MLTEQLFQIFAESGIIRRLGKNDEELGNLGFALTKDDGLWVKFQIVAGVFHQIMNKFPQFVGFAGVFPFKLADDIHPEQGSTVTIGGDKSVVRSRRTECALLFQYIKEPLSTDAVVECSKRGVGSDLLDQGKTHRL